MVPYCCHFVYLQRFGAANRRQIGNLFISTAIKTQSNPSECERGVCLYVVLIRTAVLVLTCHPHPGLDSFDRHSFHFNGGWLLFSVPFSMQNKPLLTITLANDTVFALDT